MLVHPQWQNCAEQICLLANGYTSKENQNSYVFGYSPNTAWNNSCVLLKFTALLILLLPFCKLRLEIKAAVS